MSERGGEGGGGGELTVLQIRGCVDYPTGLLNLQLRNKFTKKKKIVPFMRGILMTCFTTKAEFCYARKLKKVPSGTLETPKVEDGDGVGLDAFLRESPHSRIARRLRHVDLGETCPCRRPRRRHTVLTTLMSNATNWDRRV